MKYCNKYLYEAKACNFTKSNTPPWVFFTFFKLYKWYQIAQSASYEEPRADESFKFPEAIGLSSPFKNYRN